MKLWIVGLFALYVKESLGGSVSSQRCLNANKQVENSAECLDGIYDLIYSNNAFWFGDAWTTRCRGTPWIPSCTNFDPTGTNMVKRILEGKYDLNQNQIKYLNVTYTSPPGNYSGCDHKVEVKETKTFTLDPLQTQVSYKPWDAREFPQVTWEAAANEMYTLLVVDVGYFFMHGVYVNIPGSDMSKAEVIKPYHGPQNGQPLANPYAFLLLKQNGQVKVLDEYKQVLTSGGRSRFNISKFRDDHNMTGPVGWNWLMAWYDVYSVERQASWGNENCAQFVQKKLANQNRSFIPPDTRLKGYLQVEFEMPNINYEICCKKYSLKAASVVLDPIGDALQTAAGTRTENARQVVLRLTGMNVNKTAALAGTYQTLIVVDPDVPFPLAGTKYKPLAHWLRINMVNGDFSTGQDVLPYSGPAPPDDQPHYYYFLLYEHRQEILDSDVKKYSGTACPDSISDRCLFDINTFTRNETLTLIGATWMKVKRDSYVKFSYKQSGQKENSLCEGEVGYSDPCPTSTAPGHQYFLTLIGLCVVLTSMLHR